MAKGCLNTAAQEAFVLFTDSTLWALFALSLLLYYRSDGRFKLEADSRNRLFMVQVESLSPQLLVAQVAPLFQIDFEERFAMPLAELELLHALIPSHLVSELLVNVHSVLPLG